MHWFISLYILGKQFVSEERSNQIKLQVIVFSGNGLADFWFITAFSRSILQRKGGCKSNSQSRQDASRFWLISTSNGTTQDGGLTCFQSVFGWRGRNFMRQNWIASLALSVCIMMVYLQLKHLLKNTAMITN